MPRRTDIAGIYPHCRVGGPLLERFEAASSGGLVNVHSLRASSRKSGGCQFPPLRSGGRALLGRSHAENLSSVMEWGKQVAFNGRSATRCDCQLKRRRVRPTHCTNRATKAKAFRSNGSARSGTNLIPATAVATKPMTSANPEVSTTV